MSENILEEEPKPKPKRALVKRAPTPANPRDASGTLTNDQLKEIARLIRQIDRQESLDKKSLESREKIESYLKNAREEPVLKLNPVGENALFAWLALTNPEEYNHLHMDTLEVCNVLAKFNEKWSGYIPNIVPEDMNYEFVSGWSVDSAQDEVLEKILTYYRTPLSAVKYYKHQLSDIIESISKQKK